MAHRDKSLTPWLVASDPNVEPATFDETTGRWSDDDPQTDREKHDFCRRRTGCMAAHLPPTLYDQCIAQGCDMRWYVRGEIA